MFTWGIIQTGSSSSSQQWVRVCFLLLDVIYIEGYIQFYKFAIIIEQGCLWSTNIWASTILMLNAMLRIIIIIPKNYICNPENKVHDKKKKKIEGWEKKTNKNTAAHFSFAIISCIYLCFSFHLFCSYPKWTRKGQINFKSGNVWL